MQFSDLPGFIVLPFAESGGRNVIPVTTATPGAASLTAGFPPETMQPISAGGIPPDGFDMNGILFEVSAWSRWVGAGGPVPHDAAFATAIGGYPRGTILSEGTGLGQWYSTANNNTTDPDAGGSGWLNAMPLVTTLTATATLTIRQQGMVLVDATAGNVTVTLPGASNAMGLPEQYTLVRTDATGNTVTISRSGSNTIEGLTSIPLGVGGRITLISDGVSAWRLVAVTGLAGMTAITASGNYVVPAGVYFLRVTVTGGGGGGAGNGNSVSGGGGGAGETRIGILAVTPGQTIAVTIGVGGAGGVFAGGDQLAGTGGTTSFGPLVSSIGGGGGRNFTTGPSTAGGGGGTGGSGGTIALIGGDGGDGSTSNLELGGCGGGSFWGGGGRTATSIGAPGRAYGAGGGAGWGSSGSTGGAGAPGVVLVEVVG